MGRKFKIAQLVPYYSPAIGGVEVVCQYISEELATRGHDVHVFTSNRNHKGSARLDVAPHEIIGGVNVHRFKTYISAGHYGLFPGFIKPLINGGFDIIHSHGYRQPQSEIAARIGAWLKIPTVLHIHGGFYTRSNFKKIMYGLYDQAACSGFVSKFNQFIVFSEIDKARLIRFNVDEDQISLIRNAAENDAFKIADSSGFRARHGLENKKVVLYLGILHHFKRPELLLQALPMLVAKEPNVFLLFVGPDAGQLEVMNRLAQKLGLTAHYKWIGPLKGQEKHEALQCSEFVALPSDEDPYPLVLLEAMAHSKPVLTTSAVGQASVISENEAGIVVNPGDIDGIARAALRLLLDGEFRAKAGTSAGRLAQELYSVRSAVDKIEQLYESLAPKNRL